MPNQGHICIAITKSNMGGAQKYVLTLAKQFHMQGKKVTVLAGGDGVLFDSLQEFGIPFIKLKNSERDISIFKEFKLAKEIYDILKELKPSVLHLNSSKLGGTGSVIGRLAGVRKIIFTAHGWAFNEPRPSWQKFIFYILYWFTILASSKTICVSKQTRNQISFLPFIKNKLEIIYNGIEVPDFIDESTVKEKLASQFPQLDITKKWIGVLAELHPVKGHDILIEAISQITPLLKNSYQVIFLGTGQIETELKKLVSQKSLEEYVFFTGFVEKASQYLKAFELVILPSRSEALPLVVLEAGLAGTLLLTSNVGGIPEVIMDTRSGFLFEKENVGDLVKKLKLTLVLSTSQKMKLQIHYNKILLMFFR
jgi:glycosyltransferase involved in cell wall biosynthesis